ncbi:MAG: hypothetical protein J5719_04590 [Bacteroidales bacterium]|nr:hypothetical protein [Bacteroidales bacterium]
MAKSADLLHRLSRGMLLLLLTVCSFSALAQAEDDDDEGEKKTIDSAQAISPYFMPVYFDYVEPHFYHPLQRIPVDTSVCKVHQYDPVWQDQNIYQTLGIGAQAHKPMNFVYDKRPGFSLITLPYPLYFKEQKDLKYYDVKTSYTQLAYTYGISTENEFDATHAQHRGNLNMAFNLHAYGNSGYFTHQGSNNMSIDALIHYEIPSGIYGFRVSYIFNRFKLQENAGLLDIEDYLQQKAKNLMGYNMKLYNASTLVHTHDLLFQHYVNIKDAKKRYYGTITHSFQYKRMKSSYFDTNLDSAYYRSIFLLSPDTTNDTLLCHQIINTIQWSNFSPFDKESDKKYFFHIAGGIMLENVMNHITLITDRVRVNADSINDVTILTPLDTVFHRKSGPKYIQHSLTPFARTHIRLFGIMDICAGISYTFMGYNKNDAIANASVSWAINRAKQHFLAFSADFYRVAPDYIYSYYSGNHHQWEIDWKKQNIMKLTASWQLQQYKVSLSYFMLHHFIQLAEDYTPFANEKIANVMQLHLSAPLRIKGFGADANIYVQYSDSKVLPLPIFAGKASAFYLFRLFHRKMQLQIGLDLMYNTAYYANAYYPLLHQFYHQSVDKVGNFVYLNANLNIKVQRVSIFARFGNILSSIKIKKVFAYSNYFTTPYYPMQNLKIAIGINWRFYD